MTTTAMVLMAIYISLYDIKNHLITNRSLLLFAIPTAISGEIGSFETVSLSIGIAFILTVALKIGGGDFKLFALLVIFHSASVITEKYFLYLFWVLFSAVLVTVSRRRSIDVSVALAPSILAPFILIHLAI